MRKSRKNLKALPSLKHRVLSSTTVCDIYLFNLLLVESENQITNEEIKAIRRFFVDKFIKSHSIVPDEILLDIDGFDGITYGHQQLSLFHGYYKNQIYFPVLSIN